MNTYSQTLYKVNENKKWQWWNKLRQVGNTLGSPLQGRGGKRTRRVNVNEQGEGPEIEDFNILTSFHLIHCTETVGNSGCSWQMHGGLRFNPIVYIQPQHGLCITNFTVLLFKICVFSWPNLFFLWKDAKLTYSKIETNKFSGVTPPDPHFRKGKRGGRGIGERRESILEVFHYNIF